MGSQQPGVRGREQGPGEAADLLGGDEGTEALEAIENLVCAIASVERAAAQRTATLGALHEQARRLGAHAKDVHKGLPVRFEVQSACELLGFDPVYVANEGSNNVSAYTIDGNTGALTAVAGSPFAAGSNPYSVAVDPTGTFVYVANEGSSGVSGYIIDLSTGALDTVSGSPFSTGAPAISVTTTTGA